MITLPFVLSAILILLTPGPTNTVLAACGASLGMRRALVMPLAEAAGYVIAVSFFVGVAETVQGDAFAAMKLLAAGWLLYSAVGLWRTPFRTDARSTQGAFLRVFLTTLINPKAMLVGMVLIPAGAEIHVPVWVGTYAVLSTIAGFGWVLFGACLPLGIRRHSYRLAAVVLGGFSMAAAASAISA